MGQSVWGEGFRECPSRGIIFTPNAQEINELQGEGKGKNRKLIVCAIRAGACVRSLTQAQTYDTLRRKSQRGYHLDEGEVDKMKGGFARKSQFSACSFALSRKAKRFFLKISIVRDKMITFAADKTQLTFFLAVLRRPYSAKSGTFTDESAQVIIDLLIYTAHLSPRAYLTTRRNGVGFFLGRD